VTSDDATVVLSGAAVERCDASLLQLLAALGTSLSARHAELTVQDASPPLLECAALLGLSQLLSPTVRS
jgi:ABC-type transporter Mla MlaB component